MTTGCDIFPRTRGLQFLSVTEAAMGFGVISLAVTYLLTVYGALERKRVAALSFYHHAEKGADVAGYLARYFVEGKFEGLTESLDYGARELHALLEAHLEHPVIHYFHTVEVHKSMPRVLFLALESSLVLRTCLEPAAHSALLRHPAVDILQSSCHYVLDAFGQALNLRDRPTALPELPEAQEQSWRSRFARPLRRLAESGLTSGGISVRAGRSTARAGASGSISSSSSAKIRLRLGRDHRR